MGIERRRCVFCGNMQEIISVTDTVTIFYKCERCNAAIFLQEVIEKILPEQTLDST